MNFNACEPNRVHTTVLQCSLFLYCSTILNDKFFVMIWYEKKSESHKKRLNITCNYILDIKFASTFTWEWRRLFSFFHPEFPEINKLFNLLTGMVLGVVGAHETAYESYKTSFTERIQNKIVKLVSSSDSILPIPT